MATVNVKNIDASIFETESLGIITTNILYGQDWNSVSQSYTGYRIVGNDFNGRVFATLSSTITDIEAVTSNDEYFAKDSNPDPSLPRHTIYLGPGDDYLQGGRTPENLYGGGDDDVMLGRGGDDLLYGDYKNSNSGSSDSSITGNDDIQGGDGDDRICGGPGDDELGGDNGDDRLEGGPDDDALRGGDGADTLLGQAGADLLLGGKGSDTLRGGNGADQLEGGPRGDGWTDLLTGGAGPDIFYLNYTSAEDDPVRASWWGDWEETIDDTAKQAIARFAGELIAKSAEEFFKNTPGGSILTSLAAAAGVGARLGLTKLFDETDEPDTPATTDDVMVISDFDPREDVLYLPFQTGKLLPATTGFLSSSPITGVDGWGAIFSTAGGPYAYVFLDQEFLAEFNLQQNDPATESFLNNLFSASLTVNSSGVVGDPYPFPTANSDYIGGQAPPGISEEFDVKAPPGMESQAFGAIAPLSVKGPATTTSFTFVAGTHFGDILSVNQFGIYPSDFRQEQLSTTPSLVKAFGGDDIVLGGNGQDKLHGGDGDDQLYSFFTQASTGGPLRELLFGEAGNDILYSGQSHALLDGGAGIDTADFSLSEKSISVDLLTGSAVDTGAGANPDNTYELIAIENVTGTNRDDQLLGDNQDNLFIGLDGDDIIDGRGGFDTVSFAGNVGKVEVNLAEETAREFGANGSGNANTVLFTDTLIAIEGAVGSAFNDLLTGTGADNSFAGGDGNDTIDAGGGDNVIDAGSGNNVVTSGAGGDRIDAGDGANDIDAGDGDNDIATGNGNNAIRAGSGNDTVTVGNGNDTIDAGGGDNDISAAGGNDSIDTGDGADSVDGGPGNDTITSAGGNDTLDGGAGGNVLRAGAGNDLLRTTTGNAADQTMEAGDGGDTLISGNGDDSLLSAAAATIPSTPAVARISSMPASEPTRLSRSTVTTR